MTIVTRQELDSWEAAKGGLDNTIWYIRGASLSQEKVICLTLL